MTGVITAVDPATGAAGAVYPETTPAELEARLAAAASAREDTGWRSAPARSGLLRGIADRLRSHTEEIVTLSHAETGLSETRLRGEAERTWRQLLMFAELVDSGEQYEALVQPADPGATPLPTPDLRRMTVPLGPVAVFSASNFPLAFSVAGGDTASALAAGCPVICKAHPGHPGTSALVGALIDDAVAEAELPAGMFGLVQTASVTLAQTLVRDERVEAVGFTGSIAGGRALFDVAAARPRPIPVFAEMGSVNPVVVSQAAIRERGEEIAGLLAGAITRDAGQLCTKPGLVFVPAGDDGDALARAIGEHVSAAQTALMLGPRLHEAARGAVGALAAQVDGGDGSDGVLHRLGTSAPGPGPKGALALPASVFTTSAAALRADPALTEERFGPIALVVGHTDLADLLATLEGLAGQLTGTLHLARDGEDREAARSIVAALLPKVGRLVFDGVPTGVAVTAAQFHGGPYPATTAPSTTSVGTLAIRRFLRPVLFQNAPAWLVPEPLRD